MVFPRKDKSALLVYTQLGVGWGKNKFIAFPGTAKRWDQQIFGRFELDLPIPFLAQLTVTLPAPSWKYLCMEFRVMEACFIVHGQVTPLCSNEKIPRVKMIIFFLSYFFLSQKPYINIGDLWPVPYTLNEQDFNRQWGISRCRFEMFSVRHIRQNQSKCTNQNYFWKSFQVQHLLVHTPKSTWKFCDVILDIDTLWFPPESTKTLKKM